MKKAVSLLICIMGYANALELDFSEWRKFIDEQEDGYTKTAYQVASDFNEFQIVSVVHVRENRHEFSYVQSISVKIKGEKTVLSDVFISYAKNGHYLQAIDVLQSHWPVKYGRYSGAGVNRDEECVVFTECTDGPKPGRSLIFIRKNGLFTVFDPKATTDPKL